MATNHASKVELKVMESAAKKEEAPVDLNALHATKQVAASLAME